MAYLTYDYELDHWHVYAADQDSEVFDEASLFYIKGPDTKEMRAAIAKAVAAIEDAIILAEKLRGGSTTPDRI